MSDWPSLWGWFVFSFITNPNHVLNDTVYHLLFFILLFVLNWFILFSQIRTDLTSIYDTFAAMRCQSKGFCWDINCQLDNFIIWLNYVENCLSIIQFFIFFNGNTSKGILWTLASQFCVGEEQIKWIRNKVMMES